MSLSKRFIPWYVKESFSCLFRHRNSSEDIVQCYLHRWSVESFFKTAKQNFSLGKAKFSSEDGQNRWLVLVNLAYLIFNDMAKFLLEKTEVKRQYSVFLLICLALEFS
ncbi:transposase [Kosmotoga pacifica]|uniref:Transposase IS4-like domain-containing protein n=1 Tax=Kosmotoga pacifica TaxID=1330330 RepID=A0A0G2ZD45_9BACT|nr:transposase [Kosmotoga pacifica]AKI97986.1 hypothetical protein IX53_09295 [Kosmotoga pacifica]